MTDPRDAPPYPPAPASPAAEGVDPWAATRALTGVATQVMDMGHGSSTPEAADIGRPVAEDRRELHVSCEPGLALQQQFEHLLPEFIAVHEIQTHIAARLLAGVAAAGGRTVQTLVIRRQGYGNTLATLRYVDLPTLAGSSLRLYSTDAEDTDSATRHSIARVLLAHSRLGVVLVGDLPGHALAAAFDPLRNEMISGPWPNRHLLLLPLAAASPVASLGSDLGRSTGIDVRTTPTVTRPADAWTFISGTWTRLREASTVPVAPPPPYPSTSAHVPHDYMQALPPSPSMPAPMQSATRPLPLRPMPETGQRSAPRDPLTRYAQKLLEIAGMVSCCVFEVSTGRAIAHAGSSPGAAPLAEHGADLMASMLDASRALGLGHALPDAAVTLGNHHLVLRAVPKHPGLAMHAVLDKTNANITLSRLQIARLDSLFDEPWNP